MSFLNRFLPKQPRDTMLESVVRNLRHLLGSKRAYGSLLCHFGLADYLGEQGGRNTILAVLREIQETVQLYEPRLRILDLRALPRTKFFEVPIELRGQLSNSYFALPCRLLILFHPITGAVTVEVQDGA